MDEELYPDHLTIVQIGGDDNIEGGRDSPEDVTTSFLEDHIKKLFKKQQTGGRPAKEKKKRKKRTLTGEKKHNPHFEHFRRLVDHIAEKTTLSRKEAMKEASKVRNSVLVRTPGLKTNPKELTDAAIEAFEQRRSKKP